MKQEIIKKDFVKENQEILARWKQSNETRYEETNFAPDGIMFRGEIVDYESWRERESGSENEIWTNAPLRILFLTKDQNAGSEDAWDVRGEIGKLSYAFYRNLFYQLYGLANTTAKDTIGYDDFCNEDAEELYMTFPLARINVKKEAGSSSISNYALEYYLNRDQNFIKEQVTNLDADIIVCCGYSESVKDSGNLLLNFLNEKCGYNFVKQAEDNWIYFDETRNKLAINNWHLSVRSSSESIYNEMITAYKNFLIQYPDFTNSHRK